MQYDVIVVGIGPAGAMAAYELSRRGHRVLVIERAALPRYKTCGGGLSVRASKLVPFDFTDEIEQIIHGITFNFRGEDPFTLESAQPIAYMVSRERFDLLLASKAEEAGAFLLEGLEVLDWKEEGGGITVVTDRGEWQCRFLVAADGTESRIRGKIFPSNRKGRVVGFKSDIPFQGQSDERHSLVEVDLGSAPYGFGWLFPKRNHYDTGVAGLQTKVKNAAEMYGQFIENQGILKEASGQQVYAYSQVPLGASPLHEGRALWVGDAAGLIDPFSGEGLYYAMQSGLVAADVISEALVMNKETLSSYTARMLAEVADEFRAARRLAGMIYGWPQTSYQFLQSRKWMIELYLEILRGREQYSHIAEMVRREWISFVWSHWFRGWRLAKKDPFGSILRRGKGLLHREERLLRKKPPERRAHKRR
jgi:geranylgeranyl reductase family protein